MVIRLKSEEVVASTAAAAVVESAFKAIHEHGEFRLVLSGGRPPRAAYQLLAGDLRDEVDWRRVIFYFGDERCVPPESPDSSYRLIVETLLRSPAIPVDRVHRIRGELPPPDAAEHYEAELRGTAPLGDSGVPRLDVAFLGLGEDGHTASLFPGDPALEIRERLAVPVVAVKPPPNRITLTLPVLKAARAVVILATGSGKRDAVERVLAGPDPATPASLLDADSQTLVLDEAAAPGD